MAFLAILVVVAAGLSLAGTAFAQTTPTTMGGSPTTRLPGVAATPTTPTTARATTATTKPAAAPSQARTGARTDVEVGIAGAALMIGGALLFFGQPLRRRLTA